MEKIKLSIIVPVYNVEKYLEECLNSVCSQLTDECELILIDDGSTDSSGGICDKFKIVDTGNLITVIHQSNEGLSAARNRGLEVAKGKYIAFADSDDLIAKGALAKVLAWIDSAKADICFMRAEKFYPDGTREGMGEKILCAAVHKKSSLAVLEHIASRPKFPGSVCTKLFRKGFIEDRHFRFPKDRRYSEDLGFMRDCLLAANSFDMLDIPYYEYRQNRENSITNSCEAKNFWDLGLFVEDSVNKLLPDGRCSEPVSRQAMSFAAYEYSIMLWRYRYVAPPHNIKALLWLKNYSFVLQYGRSNILRTIFILTKCIGLRCTSLLLDLYKTRNFITVINGRKEE